VLYSIRRWQTCGALGQLRTTSTGKSITSTSQNRSKSPANQVAEQPYRRLVHYQILAANDLGMHCGDLDQRVASILPPFNVLHAQVLKKGAMPQILDWSQVEVVYSAASNPQDPVLSNPAPSGVYKTNFWDINPATHNPYAYDVFDAHYPPGILGLFELRPDFGLPVPDLQRLYLGDGALAVDQQAMPSAIGPSSTQPYKANVPQAFALFYQNIRCESPLRGKSE
jgi:hypothetical protein